MKILIIAMLMLSSAYARELTLAQKMADFTQLTTIIGAGYGPLEYKKNVQGIDLEELKEKYTQIISETKNNSEFYYALVRFVAEFKDSHFSMSVPSDRTANLGFTTDLVQGAVVLDLINPYISPPQMLLFSKGDEIVFKRQSIVIYVCKIWKN